MPVIIRDWLHRKEIEAFALALAQDLSRRFPPLSEKRTDKGARNQLASITTGLCKRGIGFSQQHKLGVYGKAKLGNSVRWQLRELGYSETFIESVTHELVMHVSQGL